MRLKLRRLLLIVAILGALSACTQPGVVPGPPTTAPQPTTGDAQSSSTDPATTAVPAATSAPAATTAPTATIEPPAPTATASPTATPDPTANAPKDQAAVDLLLEASKAQLAQQAFRATITGKDAEGKDQTTVIEYVNPDNYRLVTPGSEIIIVEEGTFIKEGSGQWQKSPVNMQGMMTEIMSEQGIERLVENLNYEDIELVGADLIGGRPMWVYQYKSTVDAGGTQVATESKNWIGALDRLPYRVEATSDAGVGAKTTSTIVYEYDDTLTIEAPTVGG